MFAEQIDNPAYMSALSAVPAGENSEVDRLHDKTLADLEDLIARAKAEGSLRADRWIEDVLLFLALNEHLAGTGHADPASASRRLLELCLAALASSPSLVSPRPPEQETVLALRRTLGHELAGLPDQDNDS